jgi:hypothetical protein
MHKFVAILAALITGGIGISLVRQAVNAVISKMPGINRPINSFPYYFLFICKKSSKTTITRLSKSF